MTETAQFKLIIEDDEGRRSVVPVELGAVSIGRVEQNTIRLNERNVSRQHAKLTKDNGAVYAEDLDSYNGVFVNGDRIKGKIEIREGDLIKIGDFHLELRGESLARRAEETTQRTLLPERETTEPEIRMGDETQPGVTPPPAAPPTRPLLARAPQRQDEEGRHEATAIIRMDAPELQPPKSSGQALAGERAKLVCVSTQFAGREFEISKTEVVIGRTDENDIAVDHRSVSRQHAKIQVQGGRYKLVDLKSANGTLVNGEEYAQTELKRGDLLELGHVKFRFVPAGDSYTFNSEEAAQVRAARGPVAQPLEPTVGTNAGNRRSGLPMPMVIGIVVAVLALVGIVAAVVSGGPDKGPEITPIVIPVASSGNGHIDGIIGQAQVALSQRRWEQATKLAQAALALEPTSQAAKDIAQKAELELKAQQAYDRANEAMQQRNWQPAWDGLSLVPEASIYRPQAKTLQDQVKGALVAELVGRARVALDQEDVDAADKLAGDILAIDPARASEAAQIRNDAERIRQAPASDRPRKGKAPPTHNPPQQKQVVAPAPPPPQQPVKPAAAVGGDAKTLYAEGIQLLKGGDTAGAIESFSKCVQADTGFALGYRALGIAYAKSGNLVKAAQFYKRYLKVNPNAPDADQVRQLLEQYETAP